MKKIGIICGHSSSAGGARAYNGKSEFEFNYDIMGAVQEILNPRKDIEVYTFVKKGLDYSSINDIYEANNGMDLSLELHFNSFYNPAFGMEMLVMEHSKASIKLAQEFCESMSCKNGITKRHLQGAYPIGVNSRGAVCLRNIQHAKHVMLYEPAFCNTKNIDSAQIIGNPEQYAKDLALTLIDLFCEDKPVQDVVEISEFMEVRDDVVAALSKFNKIIERL